MNQENLVEGYPDMGTNDIYTAVKRASARADKLDPNRTMYSVLASTMSELGELAEEIRIVEGNHYKTKTEGVVPEALDTISCLLDLIHVCDPSLTQLDLVRLLSPKMNKWISCLENNQKD